MLFNSLDFLLFLSIAVAVYYLIGHGYRNLFLLVSSYLFYASWDWRFLGLIAISTIVDYHCGKWIQEGNKANRKALLWTSILTNLSLLGVFKYFDFFTQSLRDLLAFFSISWSQSPLIDIILPVGISFYTFQTLSYTIDVYRKRIPACLHPVNFALFVCYFPQLVAGPIERAKRLLPQIEAKREFVWSTCKTGISLILLGLFQKVVIGDCLAAPYADQAFLSPQSHAGDFLFFGLCMFALQIYCDFSGYSNIARGVSRLFGIELMVNFRQPYLSRSITEFWRRWHISLSSWLRDYLYIPLGGNRQSVRKTYRNLLLTMLIGGLWHGAAWTFVLWGGLHGLYLVVHKKLLAERKVDFLASPSTYSEWVKAIPQILGTNLLVLFAWLFFRAESFSDAIAFLQAMGPALISLHGMASIILTLVFFHLVIAIIDLAPYLTNDQEILESRSLAARASTYSACAVLIWVAWPTDYAPFIYFQF